MLSEILLLFVLIMLNAFFAASEIALISLNDNKIKLMAEEGNKKAQLLSSLLSEPSKFLATIQIGITLAGFLSSAFASESFSEQLVGLIKRTGIPIPDVWLKTISVLVITIILSYFTLVLGELVPKRFAMKKAEPISMLAIRPLKLLSVVASPFVKLLTLSTNFVVRLLGVDPNEKDEEVTEEEIRMMVDVGEEKGTIQETEKEMINNIFEFDNKVVTDIMTHRTDIVAVPIDIGLKELISVISEEKYSRLPVYEESIDNIIGILHAKDIILHANSVRDGSGFQLRELIRPAYYVPSSKRTDELFRELQKNKNHMAVIIDEYDEEEKDFEKLDENTYIVNGAVSLNDVNDFLDAELPVDEYETLSGFVIGQLGRIPGTEEKPEIEYEGMVFKVEEVDEKRILKVKICRAS